MTSREQFTVEGLYTDTLNSPIPDAKMMEWIISVADLFESTLSPILSYLPLIEPCKVGGKLEVDDYLPQKNIRALRGEKQVDSFSDLKDILHKIKHGYIKIRAPTTMPIEKKHMYSASELYMKATEDGIEKFHKIPIALSVKPWYAKAFSIHGALKFYGAYPSDPQGEIITALDPEIYVHPTKLLAEATISAKNPKYFAKRIQAGFFESGCVEAPMWKV